MNDEYDRKARIYPALLAALPMSITGVLFGVTGAKWWAGLAGAVIASGFWFLAAQIGRSPGKKLQPTLWNGWGGPPTTILLRHRDNPNPVRLGRCHERIANLTGIEFPSPSDETRDPASADQIYEAATAELIGMTRDSLRFPLLYKENINYGFRRNMLGLRPWAIGASTFAAIATALVLAIGRPSFLRIGEGLGMSLIVFDLTLVAAWWRLITPAWVKQSAFAYADRLLEAADSLT